MEQIEDYIQIPIGQAKDYTNQEFENIKVLYRVNPPIHIKYKQAAYWLCQCKKCQEYKIIRANLIKDNYQCNCKNKIANQKFNKLIALYPTEKRSPNGSILWHCLCECGKECDVSLNNLKTGNIKSCGCSRQEDIKNQTFNLLTALYPTDKRANNGGVIWHCKCKCGNECDVPLGDLHSGRTQSCGCLISKNEMIIKNLLNENNISFQTQYIFNNLPNRKFDFYVNDKYIIEYDGEQHFKFSNNGWNTKEQFNKTRQNDLEKNKYCFDNKIPIIRIPYNKKYGIEDLKLETTKFLLTPNNETEYYQMDKECKMNNRFLSQKTDCKECQYEDYCKAIEYGEIL